METTTLTKTNNQLTFSDDQIALIKKQIAPKATNDELQLFLYQAKRTGLDPLTRQIYCIHRYDKHSNGKKMTVQTSIDGFRVIAERTGDYGGQDEPEFIEQNEKIISCKIRVYKFRGEQRYQASVGVAYWAEYVPAPGQDYMWKKMPHTMLSKVAEALALRKAYPQDLSGLYTNDEMQQADSGQANGQAHTQPEDPRTADELHNEFMGLLAEYELIVGEDALKYHPEKWKGGRAAKNYRAAIIDIKAKIVEAQVADIS